jgi:hypothetical protein
MNFYTPRQNQGQVVTVSYAYGSDGTAYRRTHDASDNTTAATSTGIASHIASL